jgi:hypothetical protein
VSGRTGYRPRWTGNALRIDWTENPLRRRYWELITVAGRNRVVFHDLQSGGWYAQSA